MIEKDRQPRISGDTDAFDVLRHLPPLHDGRQAWCSTLFQVTISALFMTASGVVTGGKFPFSRAP